MLTIEPYTVRAGGPADIDAAWALNEEAVPALNTLPREEFETLALGADYFRVVETPGGIRAFLIGLLPGRDYASENYAWFSRRFDDFAYVDRVAVAPASRGTGIGAALYDDFAAFAEGRARRITCEVNLRPPNPGSLRFHERLGFQRIGSQQTTGGRKEVALLERVL